MKSLLNKNTKKAIATKELNAKNTALYIVNTEILAKAQRVSKNGLFAINIKLSRKARKPIYSKYYTEILNSKGFEQTDIKIKDKYLFISWYDTEC